MLILPRRPDAETRPDRHSLYLRTCENGDGDALCVSRDQHHLTRSLNGADDFGGGWTYAVMILVTWTVCDTEL